MTRPPLNRSVHVVGLAQIAQLEGTYGSKTDQTAQTDQRIENVDKFGAPSRSETDQPPSETDQRNCPAAEFRSADRRALRLRTPPPERWSAAAVSTLPLIEALQRAGGVITLQGNRLRLSAPEPLPDGLLQELRTRKAEVIDHLQHARHFRLGQPTAEALTNRTAPPIEAVAEWAAGVARLATMPPPRTYPAHAWQQLIADGERFLERWAAQAHSLGWPSFELFGCHCRAPWGRIQGMGLVLLLRGDGIAALTEAEAVIRTRTGARQTYRRRASDPLHPAERCLVWELSDG
jgi:TubC N-terminal docking domain